MKRLQFLLLVGMLGLFSCTIQDNSIVRTKQNINREWKFILADVEGAEVADFNDSGWLDIHLPHSFSIPYFMGKHVYQGYGWYRKTIDVPDSWTDKNITLEFDGAFIEKEIFINGKNIGNHIGGYTGFWFDITQHLKPGKNVIAVRVNNLWKPDVAPRAGDHQFSGGIYRDVYLNVTDKLHVDMYGTFITTPQADKQSAVCENQIEIRNNYDEDKNCIVKTEIRSPKGKVVAVTESMEIIEKLAVKTIKQKLPEIKKIELWSPETPHLYKAITTVSIEGITVDRHETTFGIRTFEWTADKGFFLNGEHYYLRGANVHQDQAGWGDAVTHAAMRRDVQMMKDAGFNCIRGSHYPHAPAFVQACDEIGMIFFQENALWGMGGSKGDQGWGGNGPSSSCYPPNPEDWSSFDRNVLSQLKEMIKIHRNSASIAAWSMSNEPFFTDNSTDEAMKNLLNMATDSSRIWDPSREVAIGGAQRKWVDRLGKNAIAFYNGDGASREEFQNPGFPNLVSEYGSTTAHRPGQFFAGWGDITHSPKESRDPWNPPTWRSGQIIWCGFDHGTVGGVNLATMGLVDYFRLPKRQYYWYVEAYKNENHEPLEPEWPQPGTPAKLKLEASNTTISTTDGTDDVQLVVTVLDASGKHISNNIPVELQIVSGPGQFPTGRKIQFMPPSEDEASDISIRDGQAAISFRSYYGGKTIIRAIAEGLESATVEIHTQETPMWEEGSTIPVVDRPYKRYVKESDQTTGNDDMLLAVNRPSWASSTQQGTSKALVNDGDNSTIWKPASDDNERWWKLHLEAAYNISKMQIEFPEKENYHYIVEVSSDDKNWKKVIDKSSSSAQEKRHIFEKNLGENVVFIRITFLSEPAGLAEVKVSGKPT
ncbi:discoidin domain-containing protein [Parabacteroides sp. OttesenSCG-928-G06]|nr:discoidin domain-containing protein [Parabacteroides sp. OttesenSCG-928-G06]